MKKIEFLHSFGNIKLLADSRRMEILRLLMAAPATLTQLAQTMKKSPAWVRHHILALESTKFIEIGEVRKTGNVTEKYYRAKADAILLQEMILPKTKKPVFIFSGSHDLALESVAEGLLKQFTLLTLPVGSLDGLVNLRQRFCQISGTHLLDENGEYNTPFVRHLFPDRDVELITFAHRTQGLMIAQGNPCAVKNIADIARLNVRFVNRNAGSGTRLRFDAELRKLKIPTDKIKGYEKAVMTHSEAARLIARNKADVSLGLQAAADQHGLEFIPLYEERYDLVFPHEHEKKLLPFLEHLQTANFRAVLHALPGYNPAHSGEQIPL